MLGMPLSTGCPERPGTIYGTVPGVVCTGPVVVDQSEGGGAVGAALSLKVDGSGSIHIAYSDYSPNFDLKYATNKSGVWRTYVVDKVDIDRYLSLAVDPSDRVHISYAGFGYDSSLKYATNKSGSWRTHRVDPNGFGYNSLDLDASGKVHIAYDSYIPNKYVVKYATNVSGSWQTCVVDSGGILGSDSSFAMDSLGKFHVSYSDMDVSLKYATGDCATRSTHTIELAKFYIYGISSLALDKSGVVHISYIGVAQKLFQQRLKP